MLDRILIKLLFHNGSINCILLRNKLVNYLRNKPVDNLYFCQVVGILIRLHCFGLSLVLRLVYFQVGIIVISFTGIIIGPYQSENR